MNVSDWQKLQDKERKERLGAKTPEEARKIYKRQWMRRNRKKFKEPHHFPMRLYLTKEMFDSIDLLRPKGVGRSKVVKDLIYFALKELDHKSKFKTNDSSSREND